MNHRCLFSLGHDEYWSQPMRQGAAQANASGVNLAFLGANACYRQIRMEPSSIRPEPPPGLLQERVRGPVDAGEPRAHHRQLGAGPGQPTGVDADRVDVPVRRREGGHGRHRRVVLVLRRLQPEGRPALPPDASSASTTATCRRSPVRGTRTCSRTRRSPDSPTGPTSPTYTAPGNGGGVLASGSASFVAQLSTTGDDPLARDPRSLPRHQRRLQPCHGEPLRPLRVGPRQLVRQFGRQLETPCTPVRPRRPAAPPAPLPPDHTRPTARRRARAATALRNPPATHIRVPPLSGAAPLRSCR